MGGICKLYCCAQDCLDASLEWPKEFNTGQRLMGLKVGTKSQTSLTFSNNNGWKQERCLRKEESCEVKDAWVGHIDEEVAAHLRIFFQSCKRAGGRAGYLEDSGFLDFG